ncbi:MAG: ribonuclease HIII [Aquificota bacterium]|nr:ribonuclease HIII [Aquificota bacterium]
MPSLKIPPGQERRIKEFLAESFRERKIPNSLWSFEGKDAFFTLYPSGILLVQGKEAETWAEEILNLIEVPEGPVAGCDEAGKGEVFGPLILCCAVVKPENYREVLKVAPRDSKKLEDDKVLKKASDLKNLVTYRFVNITPERFNQIYPKVSNINRILDAGYRKLLSWAVREGPVRITVDAYAGKNPFQDVERVRFVKKGEREVEVAVASLLARAKFLVEIRRLEPLYGGKIPKGSSGEAIHRAKELIKRDPERARKLVKIFW